MSRKGIFPIFCGDLVHRRVVDDAVLFIFARFGADMGHARLLHHPAGGGVFDVVVRLDAVEAHLVKEERDEGGEG